MQKIKYIGGNRRKISWNSMGKAYSYSLEPGDILELSPTQAKIATNFATFEFINDVVDVVEKKVKVSKRPDPFTKYETLENNIDLEEENVISEVPVAEEMPVAEEDSLDFAAMKKEDIIEWLKDNGGEDIPVSKYRKDVLISIAVDHFNKLQ